LLSVTDVLEQLKLSRLAEQQSLRQEVAVDPSEAALLTQLTQEPIHIDELVRAAALPAGQLSGLLTLLELKGLVRQCAPMFYVKR
jgi:DNA processing protein